MSSWSNKSDFVKHLPDTGVRKDVCARALDVVISGRLLDIGVSEQGSSISPGAGESESVDSALVAV